MSILCLAGISLPFFLFFRYLRSSEYFKIRDYEYFTGQNIFKINLEKAAERLSRLHPDYKCVVLKRQLPDRIIVDFKQHRAVARIALPEVFCVNKQGVLFRSIGEESENLELPLIVGLRPKISYRRSGVKYNEESLLRTLEFINNLNNDRNLSEHIKIKEINLANINDIILFTTTGCKINLGGVNSLNKDLLILQRLISEINSDLSEIAYIELRFREPVVKYK